MSEPSPAIQRNRAVALGFAVGPAAEGLADRDALGAEPQLARHPDLAAARADFLTRLGRPGEARVAFKEALILTGKETERRYLRTRLNELAG
jgi:RNA polymerase sigma-70 factor (ECF subfamily)